MLPHVDKGTVDLPSSCNLGSVKLVLKPTQSELANQVYCERGGEGRFLRQSRKALSPDTVKTRD